MHKTLQRRALFVCIQLVFAVCAAGRSAVVTFHPEATRAGVEILQTGGNAFDAFVAATFAEYVVAEGGTSAAGSLGALVFVAHPGSVEYLDGEFNGVLDPNGRWDSTRAWSSNNSEAGKGVLVPGAVAALCALSRRYGRLSLARVLEPAIKLADGGFTVGGFYRASLIAAATTLRQDPYAQQTFFPQGPAIRSGKILRQPQLATFLRGLARDGPAYMYSGPWAKHCVRAVRASGGLMTQEDLARYQAQWRTPRLVSYRGYEVYAPSGRSFGGAWSLTALKVLEHGNIAPLGHFSSSANALELMVRTARETLAEPWIYDYRVLDQQDTVQRNIVSEAAPIWARVAAATPSAARPHSGSHSYQVIVVDREGNAIVGTHTHESLAWGTGTFVDGVPLNTAGRIPWSTRPGERQLSPFSVHLVLKDRRLFAASGAFSSSLLEASFQFLVNIMDYRLQAQQVVTLPRFGTFPYDFAAALTTSVADALGSRRPNWLDPRVSPDIVATLRQRGLEFQQTQPPGSASWVDTGLGSAVIVREDGAIEGALTPWVEITGPPGAVAILD
jgi:gamma-glutamyltranspeptidase/glutathione hydrolase